MPAIPRPASGLATPAGSTGNGGSTNPYGESNGAEESRCTPRISAGGTSAASATRRQRGDGSRPSGNTNTTAVSGTNSSTHPACSNNTVHDMAAGNGVPSSSTSALYPLTSANAASRTPLADSSQPIGFDGRRSVSSRPTIALAPITAPPNSSPSQLAPAATARPNAVTLRAKTPQLSDCERAVVETIDAADSACTHKESHASSRRARDTSPW